MSVNASKAATAAAPGPDAIRPFHVEVPQAALDDLGSRLAAVRWPSKELVGDASQGVQLASLQEIARYWGAEYDLRSLEMRLNALPQFVTQIDGLDVHFIHVKSRHANALPVIITHGWPGSIVEMLDVIGPLTDPTAHGGTAEDAFDVVIPSLPGFGFSGQPMAVGWGADRIARAWAELMKRLGYARYVAQGGDQGAAVTDTMARQEPSGLIGIHLNLLSAFPTEVLAAVFGGQFAMGLFKRVAVAVVASRAERESAALAAVEAVFTRGYIAEMNTRPQTIGYGTGDPVGMAAWMLDHDADSYEKITNAFLNGRPTGNLTRDRVLDNLTLYWLTNTSTSAARLYWENAQSILAAIASGKMPPDLKLPVGFTVFPDEIFQAPRSWADKVYPNLAYFNEAPKGGHFAAWEEPELFSAELRAAFKSLRATQS
jgi:pimeloyl-ACP methyl ester carboxylesterase